MDCFGICDKQMSRDELMSEKRKFEDKLTVLKFDTEKYYKQIATETLSSIRNPKVIEDLVTKIKKNNGVKDGVEKKLKSIEKKLREPINPATAESVVQHAVRVPSVISPQTPSSSTAMVVLVSREDFDIAVTTAYGLPQKGVARYNIPKESSLPIVNDSVLGGRTYRDLERLLEDFKAESSAEMIGQGSEQAQDGRPVKVAPLNEICGSKTKLRSLSQQKPISPFSFNYYRRTGKSPTEQERKERPEVDEDQFYNDFRNCKGLGILSLKPEGDPACQCSIIEAMKADLVNTAPDILEATATTNLISDEIATPDAIEEEVSGMSEEFVIGVETPAESFYAQTLSIHSEPVSFSTDSIEPETLRIEIDPDNAYPNEHTELCEAIGFETADYESSKEDCNDEDDLIMLYQNPVFFPDDSTSVSIYEMEMFTPEFMNFVNDCQRFNNDTQES